MATYFLVEVMQVKDKARYKRYANAARLILEKYHGEYILRSSNVTVVSGKLRPERIILVRFPNEKALKKCFDSPEYRELVPLRKQSTKSRAFFINQ